MKIPRAYLFNGVVNIATFLAGGGLVTGGKELANKTIEIIESSQDQKGESASITQDKISSPKVIVNNFLDFTLGGILGLITKILITGAIRLKRTNKELSFVLNKLQKLENNDLPSIEKTLKEFVIKEDIRHDDNNNNSLEGIVSLLNAILIHVNSQNKSVQPFLEELQKLRVAFALPLIDQLQNSTDIDAARREALIQILRSTELTKYLETTILNALQSSGAGDKISKNTVSSLEGKDLLSDDGVIALKEVVTDVLKSKPVMQALEYSISTNITEFDTADRLMKILLRRFKNSLQDNDPDLVALKNAVAEALKK